MREMRGQFVKLFRTRAGNKFYGELSDPPNSAQDNYRPRRILTVSKNALVTTGDIVTAEDHQYLVALATVLNETYQFKAYQITHKVSWTRMADQVDFVTGIARDSSLMIMDDALPVVIEYGQIVENLGISSDKYRIMTGSPVQVGDRIGAWLVQSYTELLGLRVLEVA